MTIKNNYFIWNKDEPFNFLSKNFSTKELECKCKKETCKEQKISVDLINRLQWLREAVSSTIRIHSGYRCEEHNKDIGGAKKSQHILGNAADVSCSKLNSRELEKVAEKQFQAIGIASNFLHLDIRSDKVRKWTY